MLYGLAGKRRIRVNSLHSQGVEQLGPEPRHRGEGGRRRGRGIPRRKRAGFRAGRAMAPGMEGHGQPVFPRTVRGIRPGRARARGEASHMSEIQQFLRDHSITEVEAIIPDMAGVARGKIMPAEKYAEDEGMRLPEIDLPADCHGRIPG